ncbi:MAG: hypothetical protein WBV82_16415 [Myxococcaceae bacterium]
MEFTDYAARFREYASLARIFDYGTVREGERDYPLLGAEVPGRFELVITSGFHGEEPAGPLTLLQHFEEVVDYARSRDVGLRVYPCINPSGFEDGTRYNRSGEKPNNDFLRYEVAPGQWKGELRPGEPFTRWVLFDGGPKETRAIRDELQRHQKRPNAALDIHQDRYLRGALTYAYVFGDHAAYASLMEDAGLHAQVVKNAMVDEANRTNDLGLIEYNDGSVTDYYLRRGVPYAAALETTTHASMEACHAINLIWIRGFIDLAARGQ